jgi:hypothetical protein
VFIRSSEQTACVLHDHGPMINDAGRLKRSYSGAASHGLDWTSVEQIFDAAFGQGARDLPFFPTVLGGVLARWVDAHGVEYRATTLSDVQAAYEAGLTYSLCFSGHIGDAPTCTFEYWPGGRARAHMLVDGPPGALAEAFDRVHAYFPLPFDLPLIFLSWGGNLSRDVATALLPVLESRLRDCTVFLSAKSIDPGSNPMDAILEDGLRKCDVLIAVLTKEAANSPWVIWETASAWAREKLVIPVFVDVQPSEIPGPLTHRTQGVRLDNREMMDRAIKRMAEAAGLEIPIPLPDDEYDELQRVAAGGT